MTYFRCRGLVHDGKTEIHKLFTPVKVFFTYLSASPFYTFTLLSLAKPQTLCEIVLHNPPKREGLPLLSLPFGFMLNNNGQQT